MPKAKPQRIIDSTTNPKHRLFLELAFATQAIQAKIESSIAPFGLTSQQFNLLRILRGTHPRSQCMQEIKGKLVDRNSDATRLVARMISKGLLDIKSGEIDKRKREIAITPLGLDLLAQIDEKLPGFPYSISQSIPEDQARQVADILSAWRQTIDEWCPSKCQGLI